MVLPDTMVVEATVDDVGGDSIAAVDVPGAGEGATGVAIKVMVLGMAVITAGLTLT